MKFVLSLLFSYIFLLPIHNVSADSMDTKGSILVTGGAGYIAAPTILLLTQHNYHVVVLDHKPQAEFQLPQLLENKTVSYVQADCANVDVLHTICTAYPVVGCIHFAAFAEVGESVEKPAMYYTNNVCKTITLLDTLLKHNVKRCIFSSSCSVYGKPQWSPLTEDHARNPLSPYGRSKMMVDMILEDYERAYGLQYASLRYFNAAGALPELGLGERHEPESHIIPRALHAAYTGAPFSVYGTDYETDDGTCVRDYLHIADLATAHCAALEYLLSHGDSIVCNLGTGTGHSVKEVLETIEKVTGFTVQRTVVKRRPGDAAVLVALPRNAFEKLGWKPHHSNLETIIADAHAFHYPRYLSLHPSTPLRVSEIKC
jgi:UDP-glucose 4-epimerase